MRKNPVLLRILLLFVLFFFVFILIAMVQFPRTEHTEITAGIINFELDEMIINEAASGRDYNAAVSRWSGENFSSWNRVIHEYNDQDMVIAYTGEALHRTAYSAAIAAIPQAFLNGTQRTYESGVYLGQFAQSLRSLMAADQERLNIIARLIDGKSPGLLLEKKVFDFLFVRSLNNYVEACEAIINTIDPETINLNQVAGIFEGFIDWNYYSPLTENPFGRFINTACGIVSDSLIMNTDQTMLFASGGDRINVEYNLRLGKAILHWAELENEFWQGIGRSIILSVLNLSGSGSVSTEYVYSAGEFTENPLSGRISNAHLYRVLSPGEFNPKAVRLSNEGSWAWTASRDIRGVMRNRVLDISINFLPGESHYIIIRGIQPFSKIQLHGLDWRSDPSFERYNSSGWSYNADEQTLFVKMRHRAATEHVMVYY